MGCYAVRPYSVRSTKRRLCVSNFTYPMRGRSLLSPDLVSEVRESEPHTLQVVCNGIWMTQQSFSDHALLQDIRFILEPHVAKW